MHRNLGCDESYDLRNRFLQVLNDTFDDSESTGNYFMPTADSVIDLALLDKQLDRVSQFQLVGVAIKRMQNGMTHSEAIQNLKAVELLKDNRDKIVERLMRKDKSLKGTLEQNIVCGDWLNATDI